MYREELERCTREVVLYVTYLDSKSYGCHHEPKAERITFTDNRAFHYRSSDYLISTCIQCRTRCNQVK